MTAVPRPMPSELKTVFDELSQQVFMLQLTWRMYRDVYGEDSSRVDLINRTAPTFGYIVQHVLQDAVYLGLTRLTDRAESFGRSNLTLTRLQLVAQPYVDRALDAQMISAVEAAGKAADAFRDHRNKRIAHSDLAHSLCASFIRPSREEIENALKAIRDAMNVIHQHFTGGPMLYEWIVHRGGGDVLITFLERGVRFDDLQRRLLRQELTPEALAAELLHFK